MSKRSSHSSGSVMLPGAHRQVHQRAQGWAVYWYAWRGGPQLARFGGATLEEAQAAELAGTLHGLRRSAATHLAALGWSSRKIAQVMGWSETEAEAMTAIYIDDERLFTEPLVSLPNRQPGD